MFASITETHTDAVATQNGSTPEISRRRMKLSKGKKAKIRGTATKYFHARDLEV